MGPNKAKKVTIIDHPLIKHKLTILRKKDTSTGKFRRLASELSMLLTYEVTRDMTLTYEEIETPLAKMTAPILQGKKLMFLCILRAGNGILEGMLNLIPSARVAHIGIYRDHKTLEPVEYYFKVPDNVPERDTIVVDPMLATGHSAVAAVTKLKALDPKSIKFVCLVAAPEGIKYFHEHHPDVPVFTAAIDEKLNENGYIVPGLGDAGDRLYGTR